MRNMKSFSKMASEDLLRIEVLVIIGYSFPFFNREVDNALFMQMTSLKNIYIQDVNPQNIYETMQDFVDFKEHGVQRIEVVFKRNLEQFVFPKELDISIKRL
jgi:hypothetical protein